MGVWGSQQVTLDPHARYQGVFGMWYGKWAGLARCGDALLHGNSAGASPHGGVLLVCGDDHMARSSTVATQSETMLMSPMIPVLVPTGVQEYLDLGVHGFAMSRYSGSWLAFKALDDTIECSASVSVDPGAHQRAPARGLHAAAGRPRPAPARPAADDGAAHPRAAAARGARLRAREPAQLRRATTARARASASSPPASRTSTCGRRSSTSASTSGQPRASASACYKLGLTWPLEPQGLHAFALGLEEILVVEEKRPVIEDQIRALLYHWPRCAAPARRSASATSDSGPNEWLLPPNGELSAEQVALVIAARLARFHTDAAHRRARGVAARQGGGARQAVAVAAVARLPERRRAACPTSAPAARTTARPACPKAARRSPASAATSWRPTSSPARKIFSPMGSEGAAWVGHAPFTDTHAHLRQHGRRHVLPLGTARDPRGGRRQRRASRSRSSTTTRPRRPAASRCRSPLNVPGAHAPARSGRRARSIVVVTDQPEKYGSGARVRARA